MQIINITQRPDGSYTNIQNWNEDTPPDGYAIWPDTLSQSDFTSNGGFGTLMVDGTPLTVTSFTANPDAWNAWKSAHPENNDNTVQLSIDDMARVMNSYMTITNARLKKLGG